MRPIKDIEKLVEQFQATPGSNMKNNVLNEAMNIQRIQNLQKTSTNRIWKKIVAASSFLLIISLVIILFDKLTKPAYAIEQTIQANDKIQTFHFKLFLIKDPNDNELNREAWVEYDEDGNVSKVRVDYYDDLQKDNSVQIWRAGEAIQWDKDINRIFIIKDTNFSDKILRFGQKYNPRGALQFLYERQGKDNITINIKEPPDKTKPITITADYPPNTYLLGADKPAMRDVYFVDRVTKLITSVEIYQLKDDEYSKLAVWQYEDYNQPFDNAVFSVKNELPEDIIEFYNYGIKDAGLAQGNLNEKQIAVKLTSEFLGALIDKDYDKAGHLFGGMPADKAEEKFGSLNLIQIISIGEPVKSMGCYKLSCLVGIENNGQVIEWKAKDLYVRPAEGQDNYWIIVGSVN